MTRCRSRGDVEADARVRALTRACEFPPTLTQQGLAEECDLNVIVRRFGIDKIAVPPAALDASFYGVDDLELDLGTAMQRVREANERFDALPARVRSRFGNSPAELFRFVSDPDNLDEAVELGLLVRRSPSDGRSNPEAPSGNPPPPSGGGSASGA